MKHFARLAAALLPFAAAAQLVPGGSPTGSSTPLIIETIDNFSPSTDTNYYVNPSDTCSDALYTGLSRTFVSGTNGPWCTIGRAASVFPSALMGAAVIWIEEGTYTDQRIEPVAGGSSSTSPLRYCPIGGNVELRGPASGSIAEVITGNQDVDDVEVGYGCGTSNVITINGQCTMVFGGNPTGCHITRGWSVVGSGWKVKVTHQNTSGWAGGNTTSADGSRVLAGRLHIATNLSRHGTSNDGAGQDFGDTIWIDRSISQSTPILIAPEGSTWLTMDHGGHSLVHSESGKVLGYGIIANNSWADVSGYSATAGNRAWTFHRNALDAHLHDFVINRNGVAIDNPWQESSKLEGTRNSYSNCVIRNIQAHGVMADVGEWNAGIVRGGRIAHCVFDRLGGPVLEMRDYGYGSNRLAGYVLKNGISMRTTTAPTCCDGDETGAWVDEFAHIYMYSGDWHDVLQVHGWTHQNATGNCNDTYVSYDGVASAPGRVSLSWLMANAATQFSNITCTTNANMPGGGPAAATNLTSSNYITSYTPTVGDAHSLGRGVALTTTTAPGRATTSVPVADAAWFPDPNGWGAPVVGQWAGAYQIHIEGVGNVTYTDVAIGAYPNNAGSITTSTPVTFASGAAVNYSISTGSSPNRGIKR